MIDHITSIFWSKSTTTFICVDILLIFNIEATAKQILYVTQFIREWILNMKKVFLSPILLTNILTVWN